MPEEKVSRFSGSINVPNWSGGAPGAWSNDSLSDAVIVKTNDMITSNTFIDMLDVLESLQSHNHIFYDDYTTVCECQCQCQCGRGTV